MSIAALDVAGKADTVCVRVDQRNLKPGFTHIPS